MGLSMMLFVSMLPRILSGATDDAPEQDCAECIAYTHRANAMIQKAAVTTNATSQAAFLSRHDARLRMRSTPMTHKVVIVERQIAELLVKTAQLEKTVGLQVGNAPKTHMPMPTPKPISHTTLQTTTAPAATTTTVAEPEAPEVNANSAPAESPPNAQSVLQAQEVGDETQQEELIPPTPNEMEPTIEPDDLVDDTSLDMEQIPLEQAQLSAQPVRHPDRALANHHVLSPSKSRASRAVQPVVTEEDDMSADEQDSADYSDVPMLLEESAVVTGPGHHHPRERIAMAAVDPSSMKRRISIIEANVSDLLSRVASLEEEVLGRSLADASAGTVNEQGALKSRLNTAEDAVDSLQTRVRDLVTDVLG